MIEARYLNCWFLHRCHSDILCIRIKAVLGLLCAIIGYHQAGSILFRFHPDTRIDGLLQATTTSPFDLAPPTLQAQGTTPAPRGNSILPFAASSSQEIVGWNLVPTDNGTWSRTQAVFFFHCFESRKVDIRLLLPIRDVSDY